MEDQTRIHISEADIPVIIHSYYSQRIRLHKQRIAAYRDLEADDELLRELSLSSPGISDMPKSMGEKKDLYGVLSKYHEVLRNRLSEALHHLLKLEAQEEALCRVWRCYQSLPPAEYEVLHRLLEVGESWKVVQSECKLSTGKLSRIKKKAIQHIRSLYNSDLSDLELENRIFPKTKSKQECNDTYEQLRLF